MRRCVIRGLRGCVFLYLVREELPRHSIPHVHEKDGGAFVESEFEFIGGMHLESGWVKGGMIGWMRGGMIGFVG